MLKANPFRAAPCRFHPIFVATIGILLFLNSGRAEEPAKPTPTPTPSASPAKSASAESNPASSAAPATASPTPTPTALPKVTKVEVDEKFIELRHTLTVKCDGLKEWAQKQGNDPAKLLLYLDGTAMKGLKPQFDRIDDNTLFFKLERVSSDDSNKDDNSKAWDSLFSGHSKGIGTKSPVRVTVGPEAAAPFDSTQTALISPINTEWFWLWTLFALGLLVAIVTLAIWTDLLRDSGDPPEKPQRRPYSLARCQMAFWFFVVVVAYLFIFATAGATDTITASVLGLMGISAATGLTAVGVDNSKRSQARTELGQLKDEQNKLLGDQKAAGIAFPPSSLQRLSDLPGKMAASQDNLNKLRAEQTALVAQQTAAAGGAVFPAESLQRLNALPDLIATEQVNLDQLKAEQTTLLGQQHAAAAAVFPNENEQRLNDLPKLIAEQQKLVDPSTSDGFIRDILSDANGISFHRLQIAVWTVVLGIIFWDSVVHTLSMPTFSATLLGLMGISGGTYIGFKFPEKLS